MVHLQRETLLHVHVTTNRQYTVTCTCSTIIHVHVVPLCMYTIHYNLSPLRIKNTVEKPPY